ncbi:MAG: nitroreductase family deazaflavin-dependent oxidoreductase [Actinomycetota bacterium]
MGLIDRLDYTHTPPNLLQRWMQALAVTPAGSALLSRILRPMDRLVNRVSKHHTSTTSLLAGLPILMVTTTGARTGNPRTVPLIGIPYRSGIALIASNFGKERTPGWAYNLSASNTAEVTHRTRTVRSVVRRASEAEADEIFETAEDFYAGWAVYRKRAGHRTIRVFVLHAADEFV